MSQELPSTRTIRREVDPYRFARDERGATAVEFALIATPFLAVLFAIIQIGLILWSQQTLESAVSEASRQLYTGSFQTANPNGTPANLQTQFKSLVCSNVGALFDCKSMVSVDVRVMSSFSNTLPPVPITNGVYNPSSFTYQQPARNDIVLVRAAMEYPTFVRILDWQTSLSDGNSLIMASAAFRAEPF